MARDNSFLGNENNNAKIASGLGARGNSRVQAAQGSKGTTTGDSSGTGVNKRKSKIRTIGTNGNARLGAARRNDPNVIARKSLDRIDLSRRRGNISARAAFEAEGDITRNLNTTAAFRDRTANTANTAAEGLKATAAENLLDRSSTQGLQNERLGVESGLARDRIQADARLSDLNRAQKESSDLRRDKQLGRQFDITEKRAETAAESARATADRGERQLGLQQLQLDETISQNRLGQLNIESAAESALNVAEGKFEERHIDRQQKGKQILVSAANAFSSLANNEDISKEERQSFTAQSEQRLGEANQPIQGAQRRPFDFRGITKDEAAGLKGDEYIAYLDYLRQQPPQ